MWQLDKGVKNYTVTYIWASEQRRERGKKEESTCTLHALSVFSMKSQCLSSLTLGNLLLLLPFCVGCWFCCTIWAYCIVFGINWSHLRFNGLLISAYSLLRALASLLLWISQCYFNKLLIFSPLLLLVCAFSFTQKLKFEWERSASFKW